ncbi:DUF3103 domain-containing protein [Vibrio clamense]|uniref:DUF3103 domain-containing protein n=1 Tax=Vibrio TaxID=662 RepID=UPI000DE822FC|nr:DUF3103 domain-containing protein [Vibrio cortegadensis]MDN3696034.1 DUF3103 domain-containing protein [Vibrio cortegadensis]RBW63528.1 DUF3103 domain-containing protein [Vibrionales bacterium C3R12]
MKYITPISLLFAVTLVGCQTDETATNSSAQSNANAITQQKRELARQLSQSYNNLETTLKTQINAQHLNISVSQLFESQPNADFSQKMVMADAQIRSMKGIEEFTPEILELRIADISMVKEWKEGQSPLFAFEPKGDDETWQYIEAFDVYGQVHQLDVDQLPDVPVFVVDSNSSRELTAGVQAMRNEMNKLDNGISLSTRKTDNGSFATATMQKNITSDDPQPISTTILKKIRLADDQEPWISGKAEIYAIVTGINPSRDKPIVDLVEMPYLDYDNQDYHPNQIMIQWSRYRWGAADLILMEQDDGTDYKELGKLLVKVAEEVLKLIPDPEVQAYAIIPQITGKIIDAIPDGLLVNDDDFVDVFYTLMQDTDYVDHPAASGNATATFEPLTINPTRQ